MLGSQSLDIDGSETRIGVRSQGARLLCRMFRVLPTRPLGFNTLFGDIAERALLRSLRYIERVRAGQDQAAQINRFVTSLGECCFRPWPQPHFPVSLGNLIPEYPMTRATIGHNQVKTSTIDMLARLGCLDLACCKLRHLLPPFIPPLMMRLADTD